ESDSLTTHPAHTELNTLSLHDALPIFPQGDRHDQLDVHAAEALAEGDLPRGLAGRRRHGPEGASLQQAEEEPGRRPGRLTTKGRSEEHTSELQSRFDLVCRLLLEKKHE